MKTEAFADLPIWPEGLEPFAEPAETRSLGRLVDPTDEIDRLTDVTVPSLTFCPASGKGPRPAVLVCPGGGYSILAWNHEGTAVAAWLNANGISAFLLKYRCPDRRSAAKADAVRAMRLIRARAAELNVMPDRIGILGFSAGAHLAARVCNLGGTPAYESLDAVDAENPRPDFSLLIYPAYLFRDGYALDPELAEEVVEVLSRLAREGTTMVMATHDLRLASRVADTVVFLDGGVVVEQGPPRTVFSAPERERTKKFIASLSAPHSYDI